MLSQAVSLWTVFWKLPPAVCICIPSEGQRSCSLRIPGLWVCTGADLSLLGKGRGTESPSRMRYPEIWAGAKKLGGLWAGSEEAAGGFLPFPRDHYLSWWLGMFATSRTGGKAATKNSLKSPKSSLVTPCTERQLATGPTPSQQAQVESFLKESVFTIGSNFKTLTLVSFVVGRV